MLVPLSVFEFIPMDQFYKLLQDNDKEKGRKDFNREKIQKYIDILTREKKGNDKKKPIDYYVARHFAVKQYKDRLVLIDRKNFDNDRVIPYLYTEEIYDTLKMVHLNCLHGGIKKTFLRCKLYAANIKINHVKVFISICDVCNENKEKKKKKKPDATRKIVSSGFGARAQVDLIDIQKLLNDYKFADRRCRFVLNYHDHYSKFCLLRGLRNKKAPTVVNELKEIFLTFGAPKLLQTDNGGEFRNEFLAEFLKIYWPEVKCVKGSPYHPQSQGSVERANGDVKRMLRSALSQNHTDNHHNNDDDKKNKKDKDAKKTECDKELLRLSASSSSIFNLLAWVQYIKNTSFHSSLGASPYKIVFGVEPPTCHNIVK